MFDIGKGFNSLRSVAISVTNSTAAACNTCLDEYVTYLGCEHTAMQMCEVKYNAAH